LGWTLRHSTKAAHKLPDDWRHLTWKAVLRAAYAVEQFKIPAACVVNSDKTQLLLQHGGECTYAPIGAQQVNVIGKEEKRACTIMTSLSMDGTLLPFQSIWKGSTNRSLPFANNTTQPILQVAQQQGHIFTLSCSTTYWTNFTTLKLFVHDLLIPYYEAANERAGRNQHDPCLWIIDVYLVHWSAEFRDWIRTTHPWILLQYIPAGCTGL
ncbi:hypothetical protein CALCODRAFT_421676, partial [Calocera cornea HHB12733]